MNCSVRCCLLLAALMLSTTAAAEDPKAQTLLPMQVDLKVSAQGEPTGIRPRADVPEFIRPLLVKAIKSWKFTPETKDGAPVEGVTRLILKLSAVTTSSGMALRIDGADLRGAWLREKRPLPFLMYRHLRESRWIYVLAERAKNGSRLHVLAMQIDGKPAEPGHPSAVALAKAMSSWRVDFPEWDGKVHPRKMCIPVWLARNQELAPDNPDAEKICDSLPGASSEQPIKLKSKVVGTML